MYRLKYIALVCLALIFIASSCEKFNHPKNSILGTWRCFETVGGSRQYNVYIEYQGNDSTFIILYNFHNIGHENQTYASVQDTIITLFSENFSGTGHIQRDFSAIYWQYSFFGGSTNFIEAAFFRP